MKRPHCLSDGPGGQVSLFVFNLAEMIGWLKDFFVSRDFLSSHANLLVSLIFPLTPSPTCRIRKALGRHINLASVVRSDQRVLLKAPGLPERLPCLSLQ